MRSSLFPFALVGTLLAGTQSYACDPPDDPVPCYACELPGRDIPDPDPDIDPGFTPEIPGDCACVDLPNWQCDCGHLEPLRDHAE